MFSGYNLLFLQWSLESPLGAPWHSRLQEQLVMPSSGLLLRQGTLLPVLGWREQSLPCPANARDDTHTTTLQTGRAAQDQSILDLEQGWGEKGSGIQGIDCIKLFSLPYFPFSLYLIRMTRQKPFQGNAPEVSLQLCSCPGKRSTLHQLWGWCPPGDRSGPRGARHCSARPHPPHGSSRKPQEVSG